MKIVEKIKTYCPFCKKHTEHEVKKEKRGKVSTLSWGQRQYERVKKGHGSKRRGEKDVMKVNKGGNLVLKCTECKKSHTRSFNRTKKEPQIGQ